MKCPKCGTDIPENAVFCLKCGEKLAELENTGKEEKTKEVKKTKDRLKTATKFLLWFGIIVLLVALLRHKAVPVVFVVLEFASLLLAMFVHNGRLLNDKSWSKYIFLLLGAVLMVLSVKSFRWGNARKTTSEPVTTENSIVEEEKEENITVTIPLSPEEFVEMDYSTAKKVLEDSGFTNVTLEKTEELKYDEAGKIDTVKTVMIDGNSAFSANDIANADASVTITYYAYAMCNVNVHVEFLSNLFLNKYDVSYSFGGDCEGVMPHGENVDFEVAVEPGEYTLLFTSAEDSAVKGEINVSVKGDMEVACGIYCLGDEIKTSTVYIKEYGIVKENEILIPNTAIYYSDLSCQDCEAELKELGFTNIKTEPVYDIVFGITDEGATKSVSIGGNDDFYIGDIFAKDAEVIITYHMNEDKDPNKPIETTETKPLSEIATDSSSDDSDAVWYSTNDLETSKNGNSGVFSYKNRGASYDQYYIIDFDAGYVYYFTQGNGDETCDRLKIESGDLNDVIIITYHVEGEENFSYGLHFKYKNMPSTLIVQDAHGFEYEFMTTDLEDALAIMDSKRITDY